MVIETEFFLWIFSGFVARVPLSTWNELESVAELAPKVLFHVLDLLTCCCRKGYIGVGILHIITVHDEKNVI